MFDETNDPQPTDPPTGTGGGNTPTNDPEDAPAEAQANTDPPTGTGGGGS